MVTAIMIVVIASTMSARPAAAPQTGQFDLGFSALPPAGTSFATSWAASIAIFASSANTSGYVSNSGLIDESCKWLFICWFRFLSFRK